MNRDIKFRGKRLDNGQWVIGTPTRSFPGDEQFDGIIEDGVSDYPSRPIDPATLGQYTGRKDRDGKEIYEGDIIYYGKGLGTVKWMQGKCCYQLSPGGVFIGRDVQVIGNIHDNPELLSTN